MARISAAWNRFWFEPTSPAPLCAFRILFGILVVINGLLYVPDYLVWFGAHGPSPPDLVQRVSYSPVLSLLIWLKPGDAFYSAILCGYLLAGILVTVGALTRFSLFAVWFLQLIIYHRNPSMWHQVDVLLRLWGFLLLFAPAGAMYSLDNWCKALRHGSPALPPRYAPWAQRLIQIQMCAVYLEAFLEKAGGTTWRNGTAVYFATHFADGIRFPVPALMDHIWVYQFLTYFTLLVEVSLWTVVWFRPCRYWALLGGVLLHLGIHLLINLDLLEFGIMIPYVCFLYPADVERVFNWLLKPLQLKPVE